MAKAAYAGWLMRGRPGLSHCSYEGDQKKTVEAEMRKRWDVSTRHTQGRHVARLSSEWAKEGTRMGSKYCVLWSLLPQLTHILEQKISAKIFMFLFIG